MNTERIQEIQKATAYPESQSVAMALLQVWNEVEQPLRAEIDRLTTGSSTSFLRGMTRAAEIVEARGREVKGAVDPKITAAAIRAAALPSVDREKGECEWYVDNDAAQSYVTGCEGLPEGPPVGDFCQHCGRPISIKEE